ncbi:MAG: sigma-70 family polymerase sigma factor [Chitinophagaceae bacterium]|nr:sigma-70 family polymerase sigma factor [Chitinophagaceae bacterium]
MFRSDAGVYNSEVNSLLALLEGCKREDRYSQKMLYKYLYGFAMAIALRYSANKEEASEILNDSFMKLFTGGIQKYEIQQPNPELSFKGWFKRIVINTAVDYYRKNKKHYYHQTLEDHQTLNTGSYSTPASIHDTLSFEEMMQLVKRLSPVYYTVFCLYAIDGYSHQEIADKLQITVGTSKSNLAKARMRLKEMIKKEHHDEYARYIG